MKTLLMVGSLAVAIVAVATGVDRPAPDDRAATEERAATTEAAYARGLIGGPHDFSGIHGGDACSACHIPHVQAIRPAPPGATTGTTATRPAATQPAFERYALPGQRRVFQPDPYMPGPTSLVCLGCHDGTVATSTINASHALAAGSREGFAFPGDVHWRDHPIGVSYPTDRRAYRSEASVRQRARIPLPDGRIECISCHDPHNTTGVPKMLVMSNRRSALCLSCHIK